ncbi:helix-turn-helix domain-containing protein [Nocardia asteroides]|uniref:helix-turn-helix domain-containing protein n=1 Tax=Nocardia asteroides TaxID=1824 RepID=UPI0037CC6F2D
MIAKGFVTPGGSAPSATALAEAAGIGATTANRIVRGTSTHKPDSGTIERLAGALGVHVDVIRERLTVPASTSWELPAGTELLDAADRAALNSVIKRMIDMKRANRLLEAAAAQ